MSMPPLNEEELSMLRNGRPIDAIRSYRGRHVREDDSMIYGLLETKDFICSHVEYAIGIGISTSFDEVIDAKVSLMVRDFARSQNMSLADAWRRVLKVVAKNV